jgi:colicin import membrane protein
MRILCTLISLLLHCAVVVAALYWPASALKVRLDVPVYKVNLVSLSATVKHGQPKPGTPKPAPSSSVAKAPSSGVAQPVPPQPKAVPKTQKLPEPVKKPQPAPPKPAPAPQDAAALPKAPEKPKKPEEKPKPEPEKKPEKKTAPEPEKKVQEKPKPQPPKKAPAQPSADDILKQALAETSATVKKQDTRQRDVLLDELASLRAEVSSRSDGQGTGNEAGGTADDGQGGRQDGQGLGLADIYSALVKERVQQNWRFPQLAERVNLITVLRIRLAPDGSLLDVSVETPSGRPDYDSSAVNAVHATDDLPPPPVPELQDLRITFNLQDMM